MLVATEPHFIIKKKTDVDGVLIHETIYCWHHKDYTHEKKAKIVNIVGTIMPVLSTMRHTKINSQKTASFDVKYVINDLGLRASPSSQTKEKFVILAGDSNTFGIGVTDEETLGAVIEKKHSNYKAYNFGHIGGAANNTLALLTHLPWTKEIKEKNGQMIYVFYPNWMLSRIIGSKEFIKNGDLLGPWYELKNDQLAYKGKFSDRALTTLFKLINSVDRFLWVKDLPRINETHLELVAEIFKQMKAQFQKAYPRGSFTVAMSYYNTSIDRIYVDRLIELLKARNVSVAVINEDNKQSDSYHLLDHHFSYEGHKMIEKELSEKIPF